MKKMIMLVILAVLLSMTGNAFAEIGWAGNVWPNHGADVIPTQDLDTYCQVWKGGSTDLPGQALDIVATFEVSVDGGAWTTVVPLFLGDNGANDEYTGVIPQGMLAGANQVAVHWKFHDTSDDTWWTDTADQAGNPAPQTYNVVNVLPNDVLVTFHVCLSGEPTAGDVCVIGSDPAIGNWVSGVNLSNSDGDMWTGSVMFNAGSNPSFEYKYQKDGCGTWEDVANRLVTLPTDGMTSYEIPWTDSWNNLPIGCGLGNTLEEDKVFCLQVCLDGVEMTLPGVCAVGGIPELDNWVDGTSATPLGGGLYQVCVPFSAGMAIPLTVEYKFKKDDCTEWESVANRTFVVDNAAAAETTITSSWDDGPGICDVVATEETSWDALKSLYR